MKKNILYYCLVIFLFVGNAFATVIDKADDYADFETSASFVNFLSDNDMVSDFQKMNMPTAFIERSLERFNGFAFKKMPNETILGYYNSLTKKIYLPLSMYNSSTGSLKSVKDLTIDEISTLYHEIWHCYLDLYAKDGDPKVYSIWRDASMRLYQTRGVDIHNEAYGLFIGSIVTSYVNIWRIMAPKSPEKRELLRSSKNLKAIYEQTFSEKIFGYYRRWDGKFIDSTVNLPESDRSNIIDNLFSEIMSRDYLSAYREEIFD